MILVTGATGLVGGHLIWHLLQTNQLVVATKRTHSDLEPLKKIFKFYTSSPDNLLNRIQWRIADVNNSESIVDAMRDIDIVYHCAAIVSLSNGSNNIIKTNVQGTANMVNAAIKSNIKKFCFVSSIAACGHHTNSQLIDESTPMGNISEKSAYTQSKFYAEQEVWKGMNNGLKAVIVNPGVILGYSGTNRGSSELFKTVQKGLPFYTSGGSGYVDVEDVVKLMIKLTESDINNERYIITSQNCSNQEIIDWIAEGYNKRKPFIRINRPTLVAIGFIGELIQKITGHSAKLDRNMARSATNRSYYSNQKIIQQTSHQFNKIENCIKKVCAFENESLQ